MTVFDLIDLYKLRGYCPLGVSKFVMWEFGASEQCNAFVSQNCGPQSTCLSRESLGFSNYGWAGSVRVGQVGFVPGFQRLSSSGAALWRWTGVIQGIRCVRQRLPRDRHGLSNASAANMIDHVSSCRPGAHHRQREPFFWVWGLGFVLEKRVQDICYTAMVTLQTNQCSHIKWGPHQEKAYDLSNSDQCQWWTVLSKRPTKHLHMHLQVFQQTSKCDILFKLGPAVSCCLVQGQKNKKK